MTSTSPLQNIDFGELRSLLQQAPSAARWEQLCALVSQPTWAVQAEQWVSYAESTLDQRWPDALRTWPAAWWERDQQPAAFRLVRELSLSDVNQEIHPIIHILATLRPPLSSLTLSAGPSLDARQARRLSDALGGTLRRLHISDHGGPKLLGGVRSGELKGVEQLRISQPCPGSKGLRDVLSGEHLPALRKLHLEGIHSSDLPTLREALQTGHLPELLEELGIRAGLDLTVLSERRWDKLTSLTLHGGELTARDLGVVLSKMPALNSLKLVNVPDGAPKLWLKHAPQLDALHLHSMRIVRPLLLPNPLKSMFRHPALAKLRVLALAHDQLSRGELAELVRCSSDKLEQLELSHLSTNTDLWSPLVGTRWPALRSLRLHAARTPSQLCAALASMELPALTTLDLQYTQLSEHDRAVLDRAPWRAQLTQPY
jgi:hypothetical protein